MKELNDEELKQLDGGLVGVDDVIFGLTMAFFGTVLSDWDGFKKGIMSAFYF